MATRVKTEAYSPTQARSPFLKMHKTLPATPSGCPLMWLITNSGMLKVAYVMSPTAKFTSRKFIVILSSEEIKINPLYGTIKEVFLCFSFLFGRSSSSFCSIDSSTGFSTFDWNQLAKIREWSTWLPILITIC